MLLEFAALSTCMLWPLSASLFLSLASSLQFFDIRWWMLQRLLFFCWPVGSNLSPLLSCLTFECINHCQNTVAGSFLFVHLCSYSTRNIPKYEMPPPPTLRSHWNRLPIRLGDYDSSYCLHLGSVYTLAILFCTSTNCKSVAMWVLILMFHCTMTCPL